MTSHESPLNSPDTSVQGLSQAQLEERYITPVQHWVESMVVGLNLCPFAKRELVKDRVRFYLSPAKTEEALLNCLTEELARLDEHSTIETTLVVHPWVLEDFYDYNQFLNRCDHLLEQLDRDGIYQIASFHPDYQFGGTQPEDLENYTNRAPYAVLHLLREDSLETAINHYPDPDNIPERNIETLKQLGIERVQSLLAQCSEQNN